MSRWTIFLIVVVGALLVPFGLMSTAGLSNAASSPALTPAADASAWNFLPLIRGEQAGPTPTPTTLAHGPTATATVTPSPTGMAVPTNTPTLTPTTASTGTATNTPTPTNTPTLTHTATATSTPTHTPTATPTLPPADTGSVRITKIFFDGEVSRVESDEYVEIKNVDNRVIRLGGWRLHDENQIHVYTFPSYDLQPGEVCRVYTNENYPEWCGFNWGNGSAIWNNSGDTATLLDGGGRVVDTCAYSGGGPTKFCL